MIQSIRGMRDVLPAEARRWRRIEDRLRGLLEGYAYEEIHLPLLEPTELFSRGVGEATDIVEKEMYTLADRDGDSLTLRPEGTAGCVRALLEHGLLFNQTQRVFYAGPMFRYERPQKGRYRQFYQLGAEAFGFPGPDIDAELILMGLAFWKALGVDDRVRLELNTLGSGTARAAYRDALVGYLTPRQAQLDEDSQRRLTRNPLRILDSKDPGIRELLKGAPRLPDFLDDAGRAHFEGLRALLDDLQVPYRVNPGLVRGLDYYTHTVFEWVTDDIGAQSTICAGGRYDGLVEQLGGKPTVAVGFAMGLERLILMLETLDLIPAHVNNNADVYVTALGDSAVGAAQQLGEQLRSALPELTVITHCGGGSFKSQMKKADRSGAQVALILGENEVQAGTVGLKPLRADADQLEVPQNEVIEALTQLLDQ